MSHPLFDVAGRVAIVSGAAQGMGRAMATAFAECGADLLLTDINESGVQATADQLKKLGRHVAATTYDITDLVQIKAMFAQLDREFGRIDILGNVAGPCHLAKPEEIQLEMVSKILHGLVFARLACLQEAGGRMLSGGESSNINNWSPANAVAPP